MKKISIIFSFISLCTSVQAIPAIGLLTNHLPTTIGGDFGSSMSANSLATSIIFRAQATTAQKVVETITQPVKCVSDIGSAGRNFNPFAFNTVFSTQCNYAVDKILENKHRLGHGLLGYIAGTWFAKPVLNLFGFTTEQDSIKTRLGQSLLIAGTAVTTGALNDWEFTGSLLASSFLIKIMEEKNQKRLKEMEPGQVEVCMDQLIKNGSQRKGFSKLVSNCLLQGIIIRRTNKKISTSSVAVGTDNPLQFDKGTQADSINTSTTESQTDAPGKSDFKFQVTADTQTDEDRQLLLLTTENKQLKDDKTNLQKRLEEELKESRIKLKKLSDDYLKELKKQEENQLEIARKEVKKELEEYGAVLGNLNEKLREAQQSKAKEDDLLAQWKRKADSYDKFEQIVQQLQFDSLNSFFEKARMFFPKTEISSTNLDDDEAYCS